MIREIRDAGLAAWIGPDDFVTVPTAAEGEPPREWFERLYNGRQWTPTRRGRAVNSLPGAAISPNDQPGFSPGHDSEKRATACPTWAADRRLLRSMRPIRFYAGSLYFFDEMSALVLWDQIIDKAIVLLSAFPFSKSEGLSV